MSYPPYGGPPGGYPPRGPPNMMPSFPSFPPPMGAMPPMMGPPGMMGGRPGMMGPATAPAAGMGPPPGPPGPGMPLGMRPPGPGAPPGPLLGPGSMPPLGRRPGGVPVAKATTVYVGKIALSVPDDMIRKLLESCGKVVYWKPTLDPLTKAPKGFGYCEYEDAEGVLRALRLLNGVKLDGQELLLKSNTATQKYLESYEADRDAARAAKAAAAAEGGEGGEGGDGGGGEGAELTDEQKDDLALQTIMEVATEREMASATHKAVNEVLSVAAGGGGGGPQLAPPRRGRSPEAGGGWGRDEARGRDSRDGEERSERDVIVERERERRRREEESRNREGERTYQDLLARWERHERDAERLREREKERQRDAERERQRHIKADLEQPDTDDELEPWRRRPLRGSRRLEERRKRRQKELAEDQADREKEAEEEQANNAGENDGASPSPGPAKRPAPADGAPDGVAKRRRGEGEAEQQPARDAVRPDDPIYAAMMAAAAREPSSAGGAAPAPGAASASAGAASSGGAPAPGGRAAAAARPGFGAAARAGGGGAAGAGRHKVVSAMFADEEEEGTTRRQLKPIQYSEEEMRAVQEPAAPAAAAPTAAEREAASKEALRKVMDSIPVTLAGIAAWPVKWSDYTPAAHSKVAAWAGRKIAEALGGEEREFTDHIVGLLAKHEGVGKIVEEAGVVFDEEAEAFAIKLFRVVIYETEKAALGL